jgi:hypothetical protein
MRPLFGDQIQRRNRNEETVRKCRGGRRFAHVRGVGARCCEEGGAQSVAGGARGVERHWAQIDCHGRGFSGRKYDFKPVPAQRTFAEQLLHVAGSNDLFTAVAKGEKPVDDESRANHKTKAAVVAYVKKSFADGAAVIKSEGDVGMAKTVVSAESHETLALSDLAYGMIEHSGEHYGQLVVYYRVVGLVPPESRPQK